MISLMTATEVKCRTVLIVNPSCYLASSASTALFFPTDCRPERNEERNLRRTQGHELRSARKSLIGGNSSVQCVGFEISLSRLQICIRAIKLLSQKPDGVLLAEICEQIARLGMVHQCWHQFLLHKWRRYC
jgi:hypothetical protein